MLLLSTFISGAKRCKKTNFVISYRKVKAQETRSLIDVSVDIRRYSGVIKFLEMIK